MEVTTQCYFSYQVRKGKKEKDQREGERKGRKKEEGNRI